MELHDAVGEAPELPALVLEERVARTNLSEVWRGRTRPEGIEVAVKLPASPDGAEALRLEADTVHALMYAGVPGVVPARFVAEPVPHLVSTWMGGRTLRDVIQEAHGGDDRSRAMRLYLQVLATVAAVDGEGFLHGDLKPENILVDDQGSPWLTDFGMARAIRKVRLDSHVSRSLSMGDNEWGGTLHYLPPEGLHGEPPARSWDVYAMGVILHEILLGSRPDRAATPESLRAVLPERVVEVLLRALAYSPQDRLPSARSLLNQLLEVRTELTATGPVRWGLRGMRILLTTLAAFFVALRYASVISLLAGYVAVGVAAIDAGAGTLLIYLPVLGFHAYIRWEGPESRAEAELRRKGAVVPGS